jgi:hypothetical protein
MTLSGTTLTMAGGGGGRFTVGATDSTTTSSTVNPGGMFSLSGKSCTLVVNAAVAQTAGVFQVYIDNNTTTQAASVLGGASRVLSVGPATSNALAAGDNTFTFTVPTTSGSDFLQIRADSAATGSVVTGAVIALNSITLTCT